MCQITINLIRVAGVLGLVAFSSCRCAASGNEDASVLDASFPDAGIDAGADAGDDAAIDGSCRYSVNVLLTPDETVATGLSPDGRRMSIQFAARTWVGAVWNDDGGILIFDGGFQEMRIGGISNAFLVGDVMKSPEINPPQAFMMDNNYNFRLLGDGGSSGYAINDFGDAVGETTRSEAVVWFADGGINSFTGRSVLFAISNGGAAVGHRSSSQSPAIAVITIDGGLVDLPSPSLVSGAVSMNDVETGGGIGNPGVPVSWNNTTLELSTFEIGAFAMGGVTALSRDQHTAGGVLAFSTPSDPTDAYAVVWRDHKLIWVSPRVGDFRLVRVVALSADGSQLAVQCELAGLRRACRVGLYCTQ